jgi:hypothetical protein
MAYISHIQGSIEQFRSLAQQVGFPYSQNYGIVLVNGEQSLKESVIALKSIQKNLLYGLKFMRSGSISSTKRAKAQLELEEALESLHKIIG